jgi:hypothetical protein
MGVQLGVLPNATNSATYGSFEYACAVAGTNVSNTNCSVESPSVTVTVAARHINHPPTGCVGADCNASGDAGSDIVVTLRGADVDLDSPLAFRLTRLPGKGTLLVSGGTAAAATGVAVSGGAGALLYRTLPGPEGAGTVTFGYTVSDGIARSREHTITINVAPSSGSNLREPPAPGAAGYALRLSGGGAHAHLGAAAALGLDGTGFAFGAWIRTDANPADSGAVLLTAGPYVVKWGQVRGLLFAAGSGSSPAVAASGKMLNDGGWHYVAVSATFDEVAISVDGSSAATGVIPQIPGEDQAPLAVAADDAVLLGAGSNAAATVGSFFRGDIDEVVIFNSFRSVAALWGAAATPRGLASVEQSSSLASTPFAPRATGVYSFNDCCNTIELANTAGAGVGPRGTARGGAALVRSSLPIVHAVSVSEAGFAPAPISAVSRAVSAPSVSFVAIPTHGNLYVEPITSVSVAVQVSDQVLASNTLVYYPNIGYAGIDRYTYRAIDGVAPDSAATTVTITVAGVTSAPNAADVVNTGIDFSDPTPVLLSLGVDAGSDGGYFAGSISITRLPLHGALYWGLLAGGGGAAVDPATAITAAGEMLITCDESTNVTGACARSVGGAGSIKVSTAPVYFVPAVDAGIDGDVFGFVAVNLGGRWSREARVTLGAAAGATATPLTSGAGMALEFDGTALHAVARLGNLGGLLAAAAAASSGEVGGDASKVATFAVGLQFKLGSASAVGRATLLTAGPFSLAWSGLSGLHFTVGAGAGVGGAGTGTGAGARGHLAVAATRRPWNDAVWHRVAASWNGTHAAISVDDGLARTSSTAAAAPAAAAVQAANPADVITLGADPAAAAQESLLRAQVRRMKPSTLQSEHILNSNQDHILKTLNHQTLNPEP